MISSAQEFKTLRESENPNEYNRAAHEEVTVEVWNDVLKRYPELAVWVAHNKTVPIEILEVLASSKDNKVRSMVARKRKLPEEVMLKLAEDEDESVRLALANNAKVTKRVLEKLANDSWQKVSQMAREKLHSR